MIKGKVNIWGINYSISYYSYDYSTNKRCYVLRYFNLDKMQYSYGFRIRINKKQTK